MRRLNLFVCVVSVAGLACYAGVPTSESAGEGAEGSLETSSGDGDGDTGDGDGDTDPGDGDGDTGDGDSGDGDGDSGDGDGDGDTGDPTNPYDAAANHCVEVINSYRATENLPPLQRWMDAEVCSDSEAESDAMTGTPHGAFGSCGESAQNECPGWPGPPNQLLDGCLAQMWAEGPGEPFSEHGHYINMSSPNYTKVACGFYQTGQGSYWAVQNFQ
jgi:hypothetical protein